MIENFTAIMMIHHYPFAEQSITSIRYFYPELKILVCFDPDMEVSIERRDFFISKNIEIIKLDKDFHHTNGSHKHGYYLDCLIYKFINTKYFITFDDDIFMFKKGLLEFFDYSLKDNYLCGNLCGYIYNVIINRFLPCCLAVNTDIFKKYKMTFAPNFKEIKDFFFDTGGFVFTDFFKYNLSYKKFDFDKFIFHYRHSNKEKIYKYISYNGDCNNLQLINNLEDKIYNIYNIIANITNSINNNKKVDFSNFINFINNKKINEFKKL